MISKELLDSLDSREKSQLLNSLEEIINQVSDAEKEFKNLKEIFNEVIEYLPNAIWVLEKDGAIFLENSEAGKLRDIFKEIDLQKDNDEIEYMDNFYLIRTNNKANKIIISATNITEEKRKERLASMGQIAAHLAHEIRNPIGSVALLASTLLKKVDIKTKPLVFEIKKSIWRVERIVKATLLFSKGLQVSKESYFLSDIKEDLDTAVGHYTYGKEIEFRYALPQEMKISADKDLMAIVFQNFLFNAIDAIEEEDSVEGGIFEFFYEEDVKNHIFKIYDNGKAIENKNLLFEPFKSTKTKGNGLGLALSMQIIEAHGGSIELLEEEKKGFAIRLPKESENE